jgi:eukaryotic-like serine/threonine-protein kinase
VPATALPSMEPPRPPSDPAPPPEMREQPRPAPVPRVAAASPVDVCKDKMFLSLEFCLAEQCDKPGARNHPLCVKRREESRLREDSKIRN